MRTDTAAGSVVIRPHAAAVRHSDLAAPGAG
jgi:hypothetical protein